MTIEFPDPSLANEEGLLAAYSSGIFPWFSEGDPVLWWSPDPRMVLFPDDFHISRRLQRRLNQPQYRFSWNEAFDDVIQICAGIPREGESGTWILPEMMEAYSRLHELGYAHSIEAWEGDDLIGGIYGVLLNRIFFAESMFSRKTDGSKMALARLVERARQEQWKLIDCQFHTAHLERLGARKIGRTEFLAVIRQPPVDQLYSNK